MKYICLVYGEESKIGAMTDDECMEYDAAISGSGQCLASERPRNPERGFVLLPSRPFPTRASRVQRMARN